MRSNICISVTPDINCLAHGPAILKNTNEYYNKMQGQLAIFILF